MSVPPQINNEPLTHTTDSGTNDIRSGQREPKGSEEALLQVSIIRRQASRGRVAREDRFPVFYLASFRP